ncbi:DnaJ subfamily C member 3 [Nymphon striatum]|nr:DnaJ subfamily C member 3 [Nymphon striatum]
MYLELTNILVVSTLSFLKINFAEASISAEVEQHLEMGKQLLGKRQYSDALLHFHAAVEKDPSNYLTYYKRATVYLGLGKPKSAIQDLNSVIELKSSFIGARVTRGEVFLKQGKLDEAHIDFENVLRINPDDEAVQHHYADVDRMREEVETAFQLKEAERYPEAIELLGNVIHSAPWSIELREMRADCYIAVGDLMKAIGDLKPTTKLRADNTEAHMRLSELYYKLGEADESLIQVRECLKLDPDHKKCYPHYKRVKKLSKQITSLNTFFNEEKHEECIEKANAVLKSEPKEFNFVHYAKSKLCSCMGKAGQSKEAIDVCSEALSLIPDDVLVLCDRAEAYITEEMLNEALQDFQTASQYDENSKRAQEGIKKVNRLLKQSNRRDYYKILGVKRTANKRDIIKAYRKQARKWHPDQFQEVDRKKAEKKFIDIAAAKEVLTDIKKREMFDKGEDPLDPESQQGGGFNPFEQGFHPGGGHGFENGYSFKFHFN